MRVGFYGGSFDPPSVAHMIVAHQAVAQLGLDLLFFVPTGASVSNHDKRTVATPEQRLEMCRLLLDENEGTPLAVSSIETNLTKPISTVETIRELCNRERDLSESIRSTEKWWILGADSWSTFYSWEEPEEIRKLVKIAVVPRANYDIAQNPDAILDVPQTGVSSTWIRAHIDGDLTWVVPPSVIQYIKKNRIYGM